MTKAVAAFLVGEAGRALLDHIATLPGDAPTRVLALRKKNELSAELAAGAVEVIDARRRARKRFPGAEQLFWTGDALAQATSPVIARYHAARLAPWGTVADLGCGVGVDAIALAQAGARVVAIERDAARLVFARANAEVCGVGDHIIFICGDVTTLSWQADALFWDPSRRTNDGDTRVSRHAERYEPPLSFLDLARTLVRAGAVKLSPALPDDVLADLHGSVEFLSDGRECKEACVFFGEAAETDAPACAAVLLPETLALAADNPSTPPVTAPLGDFIHDPDPAVVRAGALAELGGRLCAARVSSSDAYLSSSMPADPPRLAASYRVQAAFPYKPKPVGAWLRERGIGRLVVKKRHFNKEPEAVARELRLTGEGREATLILVRTGPNHLAVVCQPCT